MFFQSQSHVSLQPHGGHKQNLLTRLLCPWDFPGKNTRVIWHFLLQVIFETQRSNPHLLRLLHFVGRVFTTESPGKLMEICTITLFQYTHFKCFVIHGCNILNIPLHISKDINYTWSILFAILTLFLWILALLITEFNGSLLQRCFLSNAWWDCYLSTFVFENVSCMIFCTPTCYRLLWRSGET